MDKIKLLCWPQRYIGQRHRFAKCNWVIRSACRWRLIDTVCGLIANQSDDTGGHIGSSIMTTISDRPSVQPAGSVMKWLMAEMSPKPWREDLSGSEKLLSPEMFSSCSTDKKVCEDTGEKVPNRVTQETRFWPGSARGTGGTIPCWTNSFSDGNE